MKNALVDRSSIICLMKKQKALHVKWMWYIIF